MTPANPSRLEISSTTSCECGRHDVHRLSRAVCRFGVVEGLLVHERPNTGTQASAAISRISSKGSPRRIDMALSAVRPTRD